MKLNINLLKIKYIIIGIILIAILAPVCVFGIIYGYHMHLQAIKKEETIKERAKSKFIDNHLVIDMKYVPVKESSHNLVVLIPKKPKTRGKQAKLALARQRRKEGNAPFFVAQQKGKGATAIRSIVFAFKEKK